MEILCVVAVSIAPPATYMVYMRTLIVGIVAALVLPASASAITYTVIPPSNSGGDQYVESVPTASGNRSSRVVAKGESGVHRASSASGPITPATQAALVRQGRVGRKAAALARATAPANVHRSAVGGVVSGGGSSGGGSSGGGASGGGSSPVGTLVGSLVGAGSDGGLGVALPVALIVTALGVSAVAVRRRRAG